MTTATDRSTAHRWFGVDAESAALARASRLAARAAFDARRTERWFLRKLAAAGGVFRTVKGCVNRVVAITRDTWEVQAEGSDRVNPIRKARLRDAMRELYVVRTMTRKEMERFGQFSSAIMGLLLAIFEDIARVIKSATGLVRLTLKGFRFMVAGLDRSPGDMQVAAESGARVVLLSYFHLRDDRAGNWRRHVARNRLRVLLDSGAFSAMEARAQGREIAPLRVEDYADFVRANLDLLAGFLNLDVSDDPAATAANSAYLRAQGLTPIEVWHADTDIAILDALVARGEGVIAIGKTARLPEAERRAVFARVFERHPNQPFHGLGLSSELLFAYAWFSADSTAPLVGRVYGTLIDAGVQTPAPAGMSRREAFSYNVRSLTGHEARIDDAGAGVDFDPAQMAQLRATAQAAAEAASTQRAPRAPNRRAAAARQMGLALWDEAPTGDTRPLYVVQCVDEKADAAAPAKDLYRSDWFAKARAYVESQGARWLILSAEHGLVDPDTVVAPYDRTLNTMSADELRAFTQRVAAQAAARGLSGAELVLLAGERYREAMIAAAGERFARVSVPMQGLGIGEQKAWLLAAGALQMAA